MIRIAIPNKGRLYEPTISIFKDAGLPVSGGAESRKLFAKTTDPDIHFLFARAADIPEYVQDGAADVGVTGIDLITERCAKVETLLDLKFGKASLVLAVPEESDFQTAQDLEGKKVATEFPEISSQYFKKLGVNVEIIRVSGACEMTPHVGIADAIVDISSSGTTLMINHLKPIDTVFSSTVCLIANKESLKTKDKILDIKPRHKGTAPFGDVSRGTQPADMRHKIKTDGSDIKFIHQREHSNHFFDAFVALIIAAFDVFVNTVGHGFQKNRFYTEI